MLVEPIESLVGVHFPLAVAVVCGNCLEVFRVQRACPACTSDNLEPIENWLMRRRGREFTALVEAEMGRLVKEEAR